MSMCIKSIGLYACKKAPDKGNGSLRSFSFKSLIYPLIIYCLTISDVHAQGVAAGTDISNTVIVNYQINGVDQMPVESSPSGNNTPGIGKGQATVFKVDRKIDLSVTANSDTQVTPGETGAQLSFTLKNEGNDNQQFSLIPDSTLAGDNFDASQCSAWVTDINGSTLTPPVTGLISLQADQQASIKVRCNIPAHINGQPLQAGDKSIVSLFATAEKNSDGTPVTETGTADSLMGIDTVFTDAAGTDDTARDAMHTARSAYIANASAQAPVAQADTIFNPVIPDPSNPAILTSISANDSDTDGTINPSSIDLDPATPGEQKTFTSNDGSWQVDNAANVTFTPKQGWAGYQSSITYTIKDNQGIVSTPAQLQVSYGHAPVALNDSSNNHSVGSSVTINPLANDSDAEGNDTLDKTSLIFVGTGVSTDGKTRTVANEGSWTINSVKGEITFAPLPGFNGDPTDVQYTIQDTAGNVSNVATVRIDYKQITNTAQLSMNKSIVSMRDPDGGNKAISGAIVTYKISINTTGTGNIDNLVITDPTPAGMTYQPNSMYLDNSPLTDNNQDADNADFGVTHPDTATLNLGTISAGSQYEFMLSFIIN